jgi:hypothetical protein
VTLKAHHGACLGMSRGLGKLQREVKDIVVQYDEWFFREYVSSGESLDKAPWLSWPIIRNIYFQHRSLNHSAMGRTEAHASLERSLKRALNALIDRGEVCKVPLFFGWHYTTPDRFEKIRDIRKKIVGPGV